MKYKLFNYKFIIAHKVSSYPHLYSGISKFLSPRDGFTNRHTDIVIDGFPRCANTYATYAFDVAQSGKLNIAHHIHKKSQFLIAHEYGIPGILLIRNPIDCITSLLIGWPKFDAENLFQAYYFFYNSLKDLNSFVVADFESVLNNYGNVIERANAKFESHFGLYTKSAENEAKVKEIIHNQERIIGAEDYSQRLSYPTRERQKSKSEVKNILLQKKYQKLNQKCNEVYFHLLQKN